MLRRGVKEVVKGLRKGEKGIVIMAGDISPIDVISHLPVLCEDSDVPYVFVQSKVRHPSCVCIARPSFTPDAFWFCRLSWAPPAARSVPPAACWSHRRMASAPRTSSTPRLRRSRRSRPCFELHLLSRGHHLRWPCHYCEGRLCIHFHTGCEHPELSLCFRAGNIHLTTSRVVVCAT